MVSKYQETNESTRPLWPSAVICFEMFGYHDTMAESNAVNCFTVP